MLRQPARPYPPAGVLDHVLAAFSPAHDVLAWLRTEILDDGGRLQNEDHKHLRGADLAVLWASAGFMRAGRQVIGTAEQVAFRCGVWQRERQEQQMREWFGRVPEFLITLDARYCSTCTDAEFCALVEHELYHVGHKRDDCGVPMFTRDGGPRLTIRGHDVEEFVGVVRRYGAGHPTGAIAQLAAAARAQPQVSAARVAQACGTCLLRAA